MMKTKDLIKLLIESDPSGENVVYIPWPGIPSHVLKEPAYYDGNLEYVDDDDNYRIVSCGEKITLCCLDLEVYIERNINLNWTELTKKFIFELNYLIPGRNEKYKENFIKRAKKIYDRIKSELDSKEIGIK